MSGLMDWRWIFLKIYFDNCCYNRLFDDRSNIKNYLEREAVLIIMQKAFEQELKIVGSDILEIEMSKIKNDEKRNVQYTEFRQPAFGECRNWCRYFVDNGY